MNSRILSFFISIIVIISNVCACDSTLAENSVKTETSYFPLNIGNKWYFNSYHLDDSYFDSTKYDLTWEVKQIVLLDNKYFYRIEEINFSNDGTVRKIDSLYCAVRGDSLFFIGWGKPFLNSSIELHGIFSNIPCGHVFVVYSDSPGNYLGYISSKNDSTLTFQYYRDGWMDSGWQRTYKKNVGIIETHSYWGIGSKLVKYNLK